MTYLIYKNGVFINRIASSESFCKKYCAENGYTYELEPELNPPQEVLVEPSEQDDMAALLVDHEYRMTLLELGLMDEGSEE